MSESIKIKVQRHDDGSVLEIDARLLVWGLPRRNRVHVAMLSDLSAEAQREPAHKLVPYCVCNSMQAARCTVLPRNLVGEVLPEASRLAASKIAAQQHLEPDQIARCAALILETLAAHLTAGRAPSLTRSAILDCDLAPAVRFEEAVA